MKQSNPPKPIDPASAYQAWLKHRRNLASEGSDDFAETVISHLLQTGTKATPSLDSRVAAWIQGIRIPLPFTTAGASVAGIARFVVFFAITLLPA